MSTYLPTILISVAAIAGLAARYWKSSLFPWRDETAAVGGYAGGLFFVWVITCIVRGIIAFQFAPSADSSFFITGLIPLFFSESILILIFTAWQLKQLGGDYEAETEWWLSCKDGMRRAAKFVALTSAMFLPAIWLLQPGEYGVFNGSAVDTLVVDSVDSVFQPAQAIVDLDSVQRVQDRAAIPHAFALAAIFTVLLYPIKPLYRFMRKEFSQGVIHDPKPRREPTPSPLRIFNPRGGGRN